MMANNILILGIVILVGFAGSLVYRKTRIPESVFLMLIGIIFGPLLGIIPGQFFLDNASFLVSLALVIVLLDSGLGLNISKTMRNAPTAFLFTILVMASTTAIVTAITVIFFKWPLVNGMFLGIIASGTTTITITHLVERLSIGKNTKTLLILESIINDITLITAISILISFVVAGNGQPSVFRILFNELIISILLGAAFAFLWAFVFLKYVREGKLAYVFTIGLAFVIYDGVRYMGFNGAISVLVFSLFLGNYTPIISKLKEHSRLLAPLRSDISIVRGMSTEMTFLMRTLFFVFLGVIFNTSVMRPEIIIFVLAMIVAEVLSRYVASKALALYEPKFSNSVPVINTLVASGFTSTLVAFLSIEAGISIPNLTEIVLLLVIGTTLWSVVGAAILERKLIRDKIKTY